ncbi:MAG: type III pantothenate kinase, partial [Bacteroidota bacterium]
MNLCIDIGNTRTKLGLFKNSVLKKRVVWESLSLREFRQFCEKWKVKRAILSATDHLPKGVEIYLNRQLEYHRFTHETPLPIENKYRTPKTLGRDRLAAAIGAFALFPNEGSLVIDAGTCTTYDVLTANGHYLGGNITPGIDMRLEAMHHFTAKLPLVKRGPTKKLVGNTTKSALRTGSQLAALFEMEGFIAAYSRQFGAINVILTGGNADYFAKHLKTKIFEDQILVH